MSEPKRAEQLSALARAEMDTLEIYGRVMEKINDPVVRERLDKYRAEHRRHVERLAAEIVDLGGTALPAASPDFVMQGSSADEPVSDEAAVIRLLEDRERSVLHRYEEARAWELTEASRAIVDEIYSDERRHLSYLDEAIRKLRPPT